MDAAAVTARAINTAVSVATTPLAADSRVLPNVKAIGKQKLLLKKSSMMGQCCKRGVKTSLRVREAVTKVTGEIQAESSSPRKSITCPLMALYEFICR